ncbi:MAG: hypothetical protein AAAFM81_14860 [Pseudomonadota bacterium]
MLFRRVRKHVKAHDWFAVGVDFVIVVIGVFIGIQVANWNDARQTRQREAHYLERLDVEFDVIRQRLTDGTAIFEQSVRRIDFLLDARRQYAADNEASLPDDESLGVAIATLASGRIPAGSPAAFKEMVANGALETLRDDKLRQALFAYDEFAAIARDGWRTIRDEHRDAGNRMTMLLDAAAPEDLDAPEFVASNSLLQTTLIGIDRAAFFNNATVSGDLVILLRAQTNQYMLLAQQLELANDIEALIANARR